MTAATGVLPAASAATGALATGAGTADGSEAPRPRVRTFSGSKAAELTGAEPEEAHAASRTTAQKAPSRLFRTEDMEVK
ncbi:MAG: hypothetical protein EBR83_00285 [Verrucomicrobia bacterium]|nr:hypothetical protein [Verrucomicrobiota bacterium]